MNKKILSTITNGRFMSIPPNIKKDLPLLTYGEGQAFRTRGSVLICLLACFAYKKHIIKITISTLKIRRKNMYEPTLHWLPFYSIRKRHPSIP
ncbi:hypothetical protein GCM10011391_03650 [Pullulanibacillus camelliae]|uniref:Uncharacterized protein n=1 Tax=Pullulanibacillus camelliae TaxID=1707096 RepID=A0A8J2VE47_9BACL|nr:hypothetical protein GCM10011391_03650 [Pullulanibacillus camelliae]